MSSDNVRVVQRLYEAFGHRDEQEILGLIAPDVEVIQTPELPWGGHYRGAAEFREFFLKLTRHIDSNLTFERFLDAGDDVVVIGRTHGKILANGQPFDVPLVHVWRIREGKAARFQPYIDVPTMQMSLSPPEG
jgi:ketosteroid isomerase-like protein